MEQPSFDDNKFEIMTQKLAEFEADPSTWGESEWIGEIDALSLWDWAESKNRIDLMSSIACTVAHQVAVQAHFNPKDQDYQNWVARCATLAEQANLNSQKEIYVKFLEASWTLNPLSYRQLEEVDKILSSYRQLHKLEKIAYYLDLRAKELAHRLALRDKNVKEDEIWTLHIEAYHISKEANFHKGITLALRGLGELLGRRGKDLLALKFLYQAKIYSKIARTKFGIPVIEELREIRDRSGIAAAAYEIDINPDFLIDEFIKEIAS